MSAVQSVIILVINKSYSRGVCYHSYDYRSNWTLLSLITITNRAVYTRENKPRLTLAAAYIIRERNYLYEYKLPGQDKPRLEKAVNVDFVYGVFASYVSRGSFSLV